MDPGAVDWYLGRAQCLLSDELAPFLERIRRDSAYGDYVADYPSRPGKAFRPAVGLAAVEAHGGDDDHPCRVVLTALELLHNAFLVHDDLEDGSVTRRGEPSLHLRYGPAAAVHAGDSLVVLAFRLLDELVTDLGWARASAIRALFEEAMVATVEGQGLELRATDAPLAALDEHDYFEIIANKTARYTTQFPLLTGALLGSWSGQATPRWEALAQYGMMAGLLFQVVDDVKNFADAIDGKAADDDLIEGKLTPLLIAGWRRATPGERDELARFFAADRLDRTPDWRRAVKGLLTDLEAPQVAAAVAVRLAQGADGLVGEAFDGARQPGASFFDQLPGWLVSQLG